METLGLLLFWVDVVLVASLAGYGIWTFVWCPLSDKHMRSFYCATITAALLALNLILPLYIRIRFEGMEHLWPQIIVAEYIFFYATCTVMAWFWSDYKGIRQLGIAVTAILALTYIMI